MKIKSLTVTILSLLFLAAFALASCGGGGSPAAPPAAPVSTSSITGVATKGPINSGVVKVYAIRDGVTDTATPLGLGQTDALGKFTVQTFGYTGPVMVEVTGGAYKDEISGASVTLKVPLRSTFSAAALGATTMAVTPLTELATKLVEGTNNISPANIDDANRTVASTFNVLNIVTSLPDKAGSSTDDQKSYASALGAFSQLVINHMQKGQEAAGQTMDDALATVLNTLGNEVKQTGGFSVTSLGEIKTAQTMFTSTGGTTTPVLGPPVVIPAGGVLKLGTTASVAPVPTIVGIILTVNLPDGVIVPIDPLATVVGQAAAGAVTLSGVAVGVKGTISAIVTPATATTPGHVDITIQHQGGFGIGTFATINFKMDPAAKAFPASPAAFTIPSFTVQGIKLATLSGITVVPTTLAAL